MKWLKDFRIKQNLDFTQMAEKIGVSRSLYEKVEYSQRKPTSNFIYKFKQAFPEIDVNIFFKN